MTQSQFARRVGACDGSAVSKWEVGGSDPHHDLWRKIVQLEGLDPVLASYDTPDPDTGFSQRDVNRMIQEHLLEVAT